MARKKRGPGRPKVNPDNMTAVFQVRCTPSDIERWKGKAAKLGLPLGSWIRMTVLTAERD